MNNKEFVSEIAKDMNLSPKDVQRLTDAFIAELGERLDDNRPLTVQGFGTFEVKKKMERIIVNPGTKQRMLVPPKLALSFRAGPSLKDKLK